MRDTREKKLKDFEQLLWYIRSVIEMSMVTIEDEEIAPELHHVIITQNELEQSNCYRDILAQHGSKQWRTTARNTQIAG
jgi:hypothetical protein